MKLYLRRIPYLFLFSIIVVSQLLATEPSLSDKKAECQEIFNKLKKAKGILPSQPPSLIMVPGALPNRKFVLAMARNSTAEIFIQESTYDMCIDSLGDLSEDGLAYLLAHELSHYTMKHNLRHQFINKFQTGVSRDTGFISGLSRMNKIQGNQNSLDSLLEAYRVIERSYQIRKNEAEADLDAGFTCYLAGYKTKVAGPLFLDKAYKKFGINEAGGEYASKEERKEIIRRTALSLDSLIRVFELGNYLTVGGFLQEAIDCYSYVTKVYPSKEILNNAGTIGLIHASKELSFPNLRFAFPLTLDIEEIAIEGSRDIMSPEEEALFLKQQKIELNAQLAYIYQAISYFDKATSLDENYYLGDLNKSIAYVLSHFIKTEYIDVEEFRQDDLDFAETAALKAKQIALRDTVTNRKGLSDIFSMLAIIKSYKGQTESSKVLIEKALDFLPSNQIAIVNSKAINGEIEAAKQLLFPRKDKFKLCEEDELVLESMTLEDVIADKVEKWDMSFNIKTNDKGFLPINTLVKYDAHKDFNIYTIQDQKGSRTKKQLTFFSTKPNYSHSSICDIDIGSDKEDVTDEYGNPLNVLQTPSGEFLHYKNIIFYINSGSEVKGWIIYK